MTTIRLIHHPMANWPRGAWVARCRPNDANVDVWHGSDVETTTEWFAEAVWAGNHEDGELDRTDLVFGSGARVRGTTLTFVSSASTVDRLQSLARPDATWISNSLAALLAANDAVLDAAYPGYSRDFETIVRGLARFQPFVSTSRGHVRLTYFNNLLWDGRTLREIAKPDRTRDFSSFARYRAFLDDTLAALAANMAAPTRRHRYDFLGTISTGYDSPTVATLARAHGLRDVITFRMARGEKPDNGAVIAERLGLQVTVLERDRWRATAAPELPFLASDARGEDVYFKAAESLLRRRVLLTGFHGDKMWDPHTRDVTPEVRRGDQSGLSLTEYRLWAGFIHCPVPFFGVRQIKDVRALSRSAELKPWDIGGTYTRPFCRRVVEEAGVPREAFGQDKKAASVHFYRHGSFLTDDSAQSYREWLAAQPDLRHQAIVAPGQPTVLQAMLSETGRWLRRAADLSPERLRYVRSAGDRLLARGRLEPLFQHVFPWALEPVSARYRTAFAD